jgi:GDPmannose 4,6-dehydratase
MKKAFITGITGQDGSYLAETLLSKGYEVHGLVRPSTLFHRYSNDQLYVKDQTKFKGKLHLHFGDLSDSSSLYRYLGKYQPDEIYNLGAQSNISLSYSIPEYTNNINGLGPLRILDAIRDTGIDAKFYQASSSEMFGNTKESPQSELTPFNPCNPYASSKVYAFNITKNYREAYSMFICNGIMFNHESPRRGENFVTRKITLSLARIRAGLQEKLLLGNINASRDWGFAGDYVEAMWLMLQQNEPDDYVIATGTTHTVRDFVDSAASLLGFDLQWEGSGLDEKGIDRKTNKTVVEIDKSYFKPLDVNVYLGDSSKARRVLEWKPNVDFARLVQIMVETDLDLVRRLEEGRQIIY